MVEPIESKKKAQAVWSNVEMRAEWRKKEGLLDAHIGANEADKILVAICPATAAASLDPYRFHFYETDGGGHVYLSAF